MSKHWLFCSGPLLQSVSHGLPAFSSSWDVQISEASETLTQVWQVHLCSACLTAVSVVSDTWNGPRHFTTTGASFYSLTRTQSPGWMLQAAKSKGGACASWASCWRGFTRSSILATDGFKYTSLASPPLTRLRLTRVIANDDWMGDNWISLLGWALILTKANVQSTTHGILVSITSFKRCLFLSSLFSTRAELWACQGLWRFHCAPKEAKTPWRIFPAKWVPLSESIASTMLYLGMICSKNALRTDPVVADAVANTSGHLASWHTITRRY